MPRKFIPPEELFAQFVDRSGGPDACHPWTGRIGAKGYGGRILLESGGKRIAPHRYAWERENGSIPPGLGSLHHCGNPPCCNLRHLFLGTKTDNNADRDAKGRQVALRGSGNGRCKLAEPDALAIFRARGVETGACLAARFGVSESLVYGIWKGVQWGWLTEARA